MVPATSDAWAANQLTGEFSGWTFDMWHRNSVEWEIEMIKKGSIQS